MGNNDDGRLLTNVARLVKAQDLGQAPSEEAIDEEQAAEKVALVRTQTQASGMTQNATRSSKDGINYNLISCVFILLKEQGHLWKCFLLLGIATLAGGNDIIARISTASLTLPQVRHTPPKQFYSHVLSKHFSFHPHREWIRATSTP